MFNVTYFNALFVLFEKIQICCYRSWIFIEFDINPIFFFSAMSIMQYFFYFLFEGYSLLISFIVEFYQNLV